MFEVEIGGDLISDHYSDKLLFWLNLLISRVLENISTSRKGTPNLFMALD